jgi:hypothetical protein
MTREEAYKTLKDNLCAMCAYGSQNMESCDIRSCDNRDAIKALEQELRWKPVSEGLPKAGEYDGNVAKYYLVQNEYGDMLVARYTHSEYWEQIYQLKPINDEIVAWMTLPKQYESQESEG